MNQIDLDDISERVFPRMLRRQADAAGDTEYLVRHDTRITYAEADRRTDSLAVGLAELGVGRGDRVAMHMSGRPETVLTALAVNKLGAVWVPVNTDYRGDWLVDTITRSRATVLVSEGPLAERIQAVRGQLGDERLVLLSDGEGELEGSVPFSQLQDAPPRSFDFSAQSYGDLCAILWTSGTTGRSKAVLQSYNCWLRAVARGVLKQYDFRDGDVVYNVLPLFNSGAWVTSVLPALAAGVTCILDEPFSVTNFWERIRLYGATHTFTLGAMHMFLWNTPAQPNDADNPVRVAQMVPLPAELEKPMQERFDFRLVPTGYGQSECLMITNQVDRAAPPGSMGYPPPDAEIRVFDDEDEEVAAGETGEIRIRPLEPHILFAGYFEDEEATRGAYRGAEGEWYCTGDLGKVDESGAFYFVDRKKDAIRFAGRNISTMQVEGVVRKHPAVENVAAFGVTSAELASEQELKVDVVLKEGTEVGFEELAAFINENAPHYFVPRYIEFVDTIPMTPTGKAQKFKLREKGVPEGTWDLRASSYQVQR